MRYEVDVKAFIAVTVEADSEEAARFLADALVEGLSPTDAFLEGYNHGLREVNPAAFQIEGTGGFSVDGESDVQLDCGTN